MPVSPTDFRSALRDFAAGVAVVTTRDAAGQACGLTVSAFAAVSLHPPLVLVCIGRDAGAHGALERRGWFAVNILAEHQEQLSRHFARSGGDKFSAVAYRDGREGLPLLEEVVTALECRVVHRYAGGDHTIFVGQVETVTVTGGRPLVYFRGDYHRLN